MNLSGEITSRQNERIKFLIKLRDRKTRDQTSLFLVEGSHEIDVALQYSYELEQLYLLPELLDNTDYSLIAESANEVFLINSSVSDKIKSAQNTEGITAVFKQKKPVSDLEQQTYNETIVILDNIEKPGNIGAICRSAQAFGVKTLILNGATTDPYNPQVIRNSRGHSLGLDLLPVDYEKTYLSLKQDGYRFYAAFPESDTCLPNIRFHSKSAIILGNEHEGIGDFWAIHNNQSFRIPMENRVDSLNVSSAAALVLYQKYIQSI